MFTLNLSVEPQLASLLRSTRSMGYMGSSTGLGLHNSNNKNYFKINYYYSGGMSSIGEQLPMWKELEILRGIIGGNFGACCAEKIL